MPQPTGYTPATNFEAEQVAQVSGRSTVRPPALDAELSAIAVSLAGLITNIGLIQRDDGLLKDLSVRLSTLSTEVLALLGSGGFTINNPVTWAPATAYAARSMVV